MRNKTTIYIIIGVGIIFVLALLIFIVRSVLTPPTTQTNEDVILASVSPNPSITAIPSIYQETKEYAEAQKKVDITFAPTLAATNQIEILKSSLPYESRNLSLWYDTDLLQFVAQYYSGEEEEGEEELLQILKKHNLSTIESLDNYRIQITER